MHNYGYYLCQQKRYPESNALFAQALAVPRYAAPPRLAQGVCLAHAGQMAEAAARALVKSYELDPASPFTSTNLAEVLYQRGDYERARFYIRRVNALPRSPMRRPCGWRCGSSTSSATSRHHRVRPPARDRFPEAREAAAHGAATSMNDEAGALAPVIGTSAGRLLREAREKQGLHMAALGRVDQGLAEEAGDARSRPIRRLARRHLHPRPGRPSAAPSRPTPRRCCASAAAAGPSLESVGEGLNTPFRERARRAGARSSWPDALSPRLGWPACCWSRRPRVFFLPLG